MAITCHLRHTCAVTQYVHQLKNRVTLMFCVLVRRSNNVLVSFLSLFVDSIPFLLTASSEVTGITPRYKALGCFRDGRPHSVPVYLGSMRNKIRWTNLKPTVDACARLVKQRNPTYRAFGVKFYGECWSGPEVLKTYDEYGNAIKNDCYRGVGSHYTYYVYEFI